MKRLVVILLVIVAFCQVSAQAQIRHTINRVGWQVGSSQTPAVSVDKPSLEVTMGETRKEFNAVDMGVGFEGSIKNISAATVKLNFFRQQVTPNDSIWSATVCLTECYSSETNYLMPQNYVTILPGESVPFTFHVYVLEGTNSNDSLIAHIRFEATGTHAGDTASFTFIAKSNASLETVNESATVASAKILSIYPSPLVSGSQINVTMQSPRQTSFTYSIHDAYGREVAFGSPSFRLSAGQNTLEIKSLDGFASGNYALKINFQGGGSDVRVFQVVN